MNGITGRAGGIVGVRVAAGDREYPLRQQLAQAMIHLPGLPLVPQAGGQFIQQSIPPALPSYPAASGPETLPPSMSVHSSFENCYASSRSISLSTGLHL